MYSLEQLERMPTVRLIRLRETTQDAKTLDNISRVLRSRYGHLVGSQPINLFDAPNPKKVKYV